MKKNIPLVFFMCAFSLISFVQSVRAADSQADNITQKAVAAVAEMMKDLDQENLLKITKEQDPSKMVEWFKGISKSNKILGETLKFWDEIDDTILVFKDIKPQNIHEIIWLKYCNGNFTLISEIKQTVDIYVKKRSGLAQMIETTGEKAGYALAAISIAQDIYNAYVSKDERRLRAIYTTAKHVTLEYLLKQVGYSLNPFISIGIDVFDWGLNTFMRLTLGQHHRDWENAYNKYMDIHYSDEKWDELITNTFSEAGGVSQAKSQIQAALNEFWLDPDDNFKKMMNKRSLFSSTRGGALAESYKQNIIAQYYNYKVKGKIYIKLREEIYYAKRDAQFAAQNAVKKLLNNLNEDELKNLQKAIAMANDFKQAELLMKPDSVTLKPGESKEFSAVFKIGNHSIPVSAKDVKWSHSGGTFTAEKSMTGKTLEITASFSGKNGSAKIKVQDEKGEEDEADLSAVRSIADEMKDIIADAQQFIRDGSDLCGSGNADLVKIRQELVLNENKSSDSPLNKYDRFHLSLTKRGEILESLAKISDEHYISAGINKKECEKQSMEACDSAYILLSIRNAIARGFNSAPDPDKDCENIKKAADKFAAKAKEYGDKSLVDIKNVEEISIKAEDEYKSMQESLDDYLKEIQQAKNEQGNSAGKGPGSLSSTKNISDGLKNTGSALKELELKIGELEKAEARLKSKSEKGQKLLLGHLNNGAAQSLLKQITGYCEELQQDLLSLQACREKLKSGIETITKDNRAQERINYDSRENRDKVGRLHVLVRKAAGFLAGIRENTKWAKSQRTPVEQAVKNAADCAKKAQEFFDKINEIQKAPQDSGFSDAGAVRGEPDTHAGAGDADKCLSLNKEFYNYVMKNDVEYDEENRKKAFAILNRAKDCPWYKEGLDLLNITYAPPVNTEESGFSDAGATKGETAAVTPPPKIPAVSTESDPLLGDWILLNKNENPNSALINYARNPDGVGVLRVIKKDDVYFVLVHVIESRREFSGFRIGWGCSEYDRKEGEVIAKLKQASANEFEGQSILCWGEWNNKKKGWTKGFLTLLNKNVFEFHADIPPDYPQWRPPEHPSKSYSSYCVKIDKSSNE